MSNLYTVNIAQEDYDALLESLASAQSSLAASERALAEANAATQMSWQERDAEKRARIDERAAHEQTRLSLTSADSELNTLRERLLEVEQEHSQTRAELKQSLAALAKANENFVNQHRDAVVPLMNDLATAHARVAELEHTVDVCLAGLETCADQNRASEAALASARTILADVLTSSEPRAVARRALAALSTTPTPAPSEPASQHRPGCVCTRCLDALTVPTAGNERTRER